MLILNNEPGAITRPGTTHTGSIIDLTFITIEIRPLDRQAIKEDLLISSDHELIIFEYLDLDLNEISPKTKGEVTGWKIDNLIIDSELKEKAQEAWNRLAQNRAIIDYNSSKAHLEEEAIQLENSLT